MTKICLVLSFKYIEDIMIPFAGKDYLIERWIENFEEIASITGLSELRKLILLKYACEEMQSCLLNVKENVKDWDTLKMLLKHEFSDTVSSIKILEMLLGRHKFKEKLL